MPTRFQRKRLERKQREDGEPKVRPRYIHEGTGQVTNEKPKKKGFFGRKKKDKNETTDTNR